MSNPPLAPSGTKAFPVDAAELAVRIAEKLLGYTRPPGFSAVQALNTMPVEEANLFLDAAKAAADYVMSCAGFALLFGPEIGIDPSAIPPENHAMVRPR